MRERGDTMEAMARKWGNSIGIRIPASMASSIKINDGTPIDIELSGEKIIITRKKYNLKDTLMTKF